MENTKPQSILITGCSSGIGLCAARILQTRGWQVFASARDAADVERLKGEGLNAVQLDLTEPDSISMALDWVLKQTGGTLDALFNNGAFAIPAALEDLSRNALAYQLDTGLLGMAYDDGERRVACQTPATGVQQQCTAPVALGGEDGAASHQISAEGLPGEAAQRHHPFLAALAPEPQPRGLVVHDRGDVVDIEIGDLGDTGACPVEHLQQDGISHSYGVIPVR